MESVTPVCRLLMLQRSAPGMQPRRYPGNNLRIAAQLGMISAAHRVLRNHVSMQQAAALLIQLLYEHRHCYRLWQWGTQTLDFDNRKGFLDNLKL